MHLLHWQANSLPLSHLRNPKEQIPGLFTTTPVSSSSPAETLLTNHSVVLNKQHFLPFFFLMYNFPYCVNQLAMGQNIESIHHQGLINPKVFSIHYHFSWVKSPLPLMTFYLCLFIKHFANVSQGKTLVSSAPMISNAESMRFLFGICVIRH